jgi:hypothetical protein
VAGMPAGAVPEADDFAASTIFIVVSPDHASIGLLLGHAEGDRTS